MRIYPLGVFLICSLLFTTTVLEAQGTAPKSLSSVNSPRIDVLSQELSRGRADALDAFWQQIRSPLIEAIPGDTEHSLVTFLWKGEPGTQRVTLLGGLPAANLAKPLSRLGNTHLWYLTETHSSQARFQYVFQINGPESLAMEWGTLMKQMHDDPPKPDPLNPNVYWGWSYVELAHAPVQRWIKRQPGTPQGTLTQHQLDSKFLKARYALRVYTPPAYSEGTSPCWLAVAFDGGFQMEDVTLDNLTAAKKIPPLVVVGVENLSDESRERDLDCSDAFASFLAEELVPWARKNYRVSQDARHTIVGGASLGGKMAAYSAMLHPEVFGKVLSQSGAFVSAARQISPSFLWDGEAPRMLAREFVNRPLIPVEFYIEVGRYETTLPFSQLLETRRLRDVLQAKGNRVTYSEFVGGHNEVCWRGSLGDAIMALTAKAP